MDDLPSPRDWEGFERVVRWTRASRPPDPPEPVLDRGRVAVETAATLLVLRAQEVRKSLATGVGRTALAALKVAVREASDRVLTALDDLDWG
jgi:hypothetical protein